MADRTLPGLGIVQRQVTARPTQALQGQRVDANIMPGADSFAKGLAQFADTGTAVVRQQHQDNQDAQAAVADIGLDGYNKSMKARLEAEPDLFDRPDDLAKFDQELRDSYFKDVTDDRIREKVTMRVDGLLQSTGTAWKYEKEAKQRFDLGSRTMQLNVEKLEAQYAAGDITEEQATSQIKTLFTSLRESPSFRLSKETSEKLVQNLQEAYAKDGTRRLLLAKAFKDDENISTETRLTLHLDQVEAEKLTTQEKETKKFELLKSWEPLIQSGKFTWAMGEKAVKAGLVTAGDIRSSMRYQQTEMERKIKEAQKAAAIATGNPLQMDAKTFKKWEEQARATLPKDRYYSLMHQTGGANPVVVAQADRAFSTASSLVETEAQIPEAFRQFTQGDAAYLYGAGLLSQHLPPERLEDTATYMFMTQTLGKSPVDAYNLMVKGGFEKYSDVDRMRLANLKSSLRSSPGFFGGGGLGLDKDAPNNIIDATASLSMKLAKAGMDPDAATKTAKEMVKTAYVSTDYGPLPKARFGMYTSEEGLKKRLDYTAEETVKRLNADGNDIKKGDLQVMLLDNGRFTFTQRGGVTPVSMTAYRLMTDNAPETPDGTQTVEGARQDKVINDTIKSKPTDGITASQAWRDR